MFFAINAVVGPCLMQTFSDERFDIAVRFADPVLSAFLVDDEAGAILEIRQGQLPGVMAKTDREFLSVLEGGHECSFLLLASSLFRKTEGGWSRCAANWNRS